MADDRSKHHTGSATKRLAVAALLVTAALATLTHVQAAPPESELSAFQQYTPCPATGQRKGACTGYRIAYKVPPCAGGQDRWTNLIWLTEAAAKQKLQNDAATCAGRVK